MDNYLHRVFDYSAPPPPPPSAAVARGGLTPQARSCHGAERRATRLAKENSSEAATWHAGPLSAEALVAMQFFDYRPLAALALLGRNSVAW